MIQLIKRRSVLTLGHRGYRFGGIGWGKVCVSEIYILDGVCVLFFEKILKFCCFFLVFSFV